MNQSTPSKFSIAIQFLLSADEVALDGVLCFVDFVVKRRRLLLDNGAGNHLPGGAQNGPELLLRGDINIRDILPKSAIAGRRGCAYLFLAEEREVEDDLQRLGVSRDQDEFRDVAVERLGSLIGTFLDLF